MENKFIFGDQVVLKSGSPVLTVEYVDNGVAVIRWFDKMTNKFNVDKIHLTSLIALSDAQTYQVYW